MRLPNYILEAKKHLYHLLLQKDIKTLTENEVNIAYLLAGDKDIQEILDKSLKKAGD